MGAAEKSKELFTASEVARFCQVDLKTIHNWADRGELAHFRTPGRHLRFRRGDVLDFLRRYGYPIPVGMVQERPRVMIVESNRTVATELADALTDDFDVDLHSDALRALLQIGSRPPDAMVLGRVVDLDPRHLVQEVKRFPHTRHVRIMVFGSHPRQRDGLLDAGASGIVGAADRSGLRAKLFAVLGVERRFAASL
jgi:excisionase family DNA binding protein